VGLLTWVLRKSNFIAIKALSLLFINLKGEVWINFILCQPFVMEAIEAKCEFEEEEWTEYYISFLKSLSIRLSEAQISVFFNKVSQSLVRKVAPTPSYTRP
jgi:intracellular septation protein A